MDTTNLAQDSMVPVTGVYCCGMCRDADPFLKELLRRDATSRGVPSSAVEAVFQSHGMGSDATITRTSFVAGDRFGACPKHKEKTVWTLEADGAPSSVPAPTQLQKEEAQEVVRQATPAFFKKNGASWTHEPWLSFLSEIRTTVPAALLSDAEVGKILESEAAREGTRRREASRLSAQHKRDSQLVEPLLQAVRSLDAPAVQAALARGDYVPSQEEIQLTFRNYAGHDSSVGAVALWLAVRFIRHDMVAALLNLGVDANTSSSGGFTVLMLASRWGMELAAEALLAGGADVTARTAEGDTALTYGAGRVELVKAFVARGADVNARTTNGYTALMTAAHNGSLEAVQLLLARGADVNVSTSKGETALMDAAYRGKAEVVEALLAKGADVNASMTNGETALIVAARFGKPEIARVLLAHGADLNAMANGISAIALTTVRGTALTLASNEHHRDVVEVIKNAQAKAKAARPSAFKRLQNLFRKPDR